MNPPALPFDGYKWRWAAVECTEGLNNPPVFLGVLRAMRKHEGQAPSNRSFIRDLQKVEEDTDTRVNLRRTPQRNLIRNSGQYWKAFDLLRDTRGNISLTEFGRRVADGKITQIEFATTVIKTLRLPNTQIESNISRWESAGLNIKPLELILDILGELKRSHGSKQAYINHFELIRIVIPLAGEQAPISKHVRAVRLFREGRLILRDWPECAPRANDKRIAREFLLFLNHYGFCRRTRGRTNEEDKYWLSAVLEPDEIADLSGIDTEELTSTQAFNILQSNGITATVERRRIIAEILERPQQIKFRKDILRAYRSKCLVTGVTIPEVLIAAHIIPVKQNGLDTIDNGLCLRADIHLLFDSGHLRIRHNGNIRLTSSASKGGNYRNLPSNLTIPAFVKRNNLKWRWDYPWR